MSTLTRMLEEYRIPPVARVTQLFDASGIASPGEYLRARLEPMRHSVKPGARIAITAGSRGIAGYLTIMRGIVDFVRDCGGDPFIVPSMGSHGGATAEGQLAMLAHLGLTPESVGAPFLSSMEVARIGMTEAGLPVFIDRHAYEADGIILFNRIKSHTSIRDRYESGLLKMLAIGLAKHKGAAMTHALGVPRMGENMQRVGKISLEKLNVLFGVATIENGYNDLADIFVLDKRGILEQEPAILQRARQLTPRILLDEVDALVVVNQGKDISGTGMDPAVVGRPINRKPNEGIRVEALGVLRLTPASAGNAVGCGLADFMAQGLRDAMEEEYMKVNATTGMQPVLGKIPITVASEELVFKACMRYSSVIETDRVKLVIIPDTKHLEEVYMSRAAVASAGSDAKLQVESGYFEVPFDSEGRLTL